jgi:hypothetical protein
LLEAAAVFKPETLVRWHRSGFRLYWRWKSRRRVGRPAVPADIRDLIRTISRDNPLWGAPRIHGELLKLGVDIAQSTVAKYMSRRHGPRSPGWQAFLRNHTAWHQRFVPGRVSQSAFTRHAAKPCESLSAPVALGMTGEPLSRRRPSHGVAMQGSAK